MSTATAPVDPAKRILPAKVKPAAVVVLAFTTLLYLVELVDAGLHHRLDDEGIVPRTLSGLDGVVWAPLLHGSWTHLFANTIPVLVFGFLALASGVGRWLAVTGLIWVVSGLGVWLTGVDHTSTIGASGVAFGWLAYLLVRGLFNRAFGQLVVAGVLLLVWGGTLWGLLPGNPGISWQAHVFGALGGILAAWFAAAADRAKARKQLA
ncbi:membrane associated rhomboid family serine protease [Amycolatopsis bartoniae]|uniref:Rhomboid family intramembrane serine protease n=1 Tax=Amycolatopsis bartoniae TaxID=941986 RepID=A0A8H9J5R1_9PSEU|nr:rhomboid family intramembrane serine protease [Amycolatopsis bartoniae]MBB2936166.1 membrane associated rhomboid family serine protease [Amycolatopsis bartoniae]TVT07124.1 rhomboid family intramembrane serine protease [Amycolatopsis bartoniae]GHF81080.1 rhomboid family intramembrane serine protease [Amycolatopsis bartoniae]